MQLQKSASRNSESSQTVHTNHEASSRGRGVREVHSSSDHSASMAQILQVKVRKIPSKMWTKIILKKNTPKPWKTSVFWYSLTYRAPSCTWTFTPTPFTSIPPLFATSLPILYRHLINLSYTFKLLIEQSVFYWFLLVTQKNLC